MKKKLLRVVSLILVLLSLLACLSACKKGAEEADSGNATATVEAGDGIATDENGYVKDTINRTLGGREINVLIDTSSLNDIFPAEHTAGVNVVQDQAFNRTADLEVRLDCTFKVTTAAGEYVGMSDFMSVAEKSGDIGTDLICAFSLVPSQLQQKGLLSNLNNLEYPQLEMPWYPESVRNWEHDGALYYVSNNSSNRVIRAQEVVLVNRDIIAADDSLEPIEQIVIDGDWTLDVMLSYAKTVETDVSLPEKQRVYGLAVDDYSRMDQFYYGAGLNMTQRTADGKITLSAFEQSHIDKTTNLILKLGTIASTPSFFIDKNNASELMATNQAMFFAGHMNWLLKLDGGTSYFPVPAPKYDEEQERYYTTPHNSYDV